MCTIFETADHGLTAKRTETGRLAEERWMDIVAWSAAIGHVAPLVDEVVDRTPHHDDPVRRILLLG